MRDKSGSRKVRAALQAESSYSTPSTRRTSPPVLLPSEVARSMKVLLLAALLVCTLVSLHISVPAAAAEPLCEVPAGQLIRGPGPVDVPKPQDRSLLPLQYAGRTM